SSSTSAFAAWAGAAATIDVATSPAAAIVRDRGPNSFIWSSLQALSIAPRRSHRQHGSAGQSARLGRFYSDWRPQGNGFGGPEGRFRAYWRVCDPRSGGDVTAAGPYRRWPGGGRPVANGARGRRGRVIRPRQDGQ